MANLQMVVSRVEFRHARRRDHGMPCSDGPNHTGQSSRGPTTGTSAPSVTAADDSFFARADLPTRRPLPVTNGHGRVRRLARSRGCHFRSAAPNGTENRSHQITTLPQV